MNILMISPAFAPFSGVGAARMTSLAEFLIGKGCQVVVITYSQSYFKNDCMKRKVPDGVKVIEVCTEGDIGKNLEKEVLNTISKVNFDLSITSVGPYDSMKFIWKLKRQWNLNYIIDYRDPWLFEKRDKRTFSRLFRLKLAIYNIVNIPCEFRDVRHAAAIVSVAPQNEKELQKRYFVCREKFHVIFNGYEDLPERQEIQKDEKDTTFHLGIAGKFGYYDPETAQNVLNIIREKNLQGKRVILEHIGAVEEEVQVFLRNFEDANLIYHCHGQMDHAQTMKKLQSMDAFLIVYAHRAGLGTKLFDYIGLNKPIVYMGVYPSELADYMGQFEGAAICSNEKEFGDCLEHMLKKADAFLTDRDTSIFSRREQNENYYRLIADICRKGKGSEA